MFLQFLNIVWNKPHCVLCVPKVKLLPTCLIILGRNIVYGTCSTCKVHAKQVKPSLLVKLFREVIRASAVASKSRNVYAGAGKVTPCVGVWTV